MINYTQKRRKPRKSQIYCKISKIYKNMAKYINPAVIEAAMNVLQQHREKHPETVTPLHDLCKTSDEHTRAVFVRAAQRLKWNVVRTRGHVYENGQFIW